MIKITVIQNAR